MIMYDEVSEVEVHLYLEILMYDLWMHARLRWPRIFISLWYPCHDMISRTLLRYLHVDRYLSTYRYRGTNIIIGP